MPLSTTYAVETLPKTMYLTESISSSATSMKINYVPLAMTKGILIVDEGLSTEERIAFNSVTDNGDDTATLGDLTRGLAYSGTTFTGDSSRAYAHTGNASTVRLIVAHELISLSAKTDVDSAFTVKQTFGKGLRLSPFANTGARDAYFTAPAEGDKCFVTAVGEQVYSGGAWVTINGSPNVSGSTTVNGTYEAATAAERAAGTSTGGTGALLIPTNDALVKTSSGAGDENKIPVLNASGTLATGFQGTGTANSSTFLRGDGAWTNILSSIGLFGTGSDGAPSWTSGASLNPAGEFQYTTATLPVSQTLTVSSVNSVLVIHNTGDVTINGTLDLNGKGGAGAVQVASSSDGGAGTAGNSKISGYTNGAGGGGTKGAAGAVGAASTKIDANQFAFLQSFLRGVVCGGGGGAGGGGNSGAGGTGGAGGAGGGACVWYIGGNLTLGASSVIRCSGGNGSNGGDDGGGLGGGGGGGGGGGHIVILVAGTITNSGATLQAAGGTGGSAGAKSGGTSPGGGGSGSSDVTSGSAGTAGVGATGASGKVVIYSLSSGTTITS